jgi:hypothetical protein
MSYSNKSTTLTAAVLLTLTAFSCSLPLFSRNQAQSPSAANVANATGGVVGNSVDKNFQPRPAKVSGVLSFSPGCEAGYYQIKLQGIFEGSQVQVESQTDQSGHFALVAPAGKYLMTVTKENCGSKQTVELEENTEHMFSVSIDLNKSTEKVSEVGGRLPASVLIEPTK